MGQIAHPGRLGRGAALAAAGALAVGGVTAGCSTSVSSLATELRSPVAVTVVHADGSTVTGVDGLRLHSGDVVRTGPAGRADLRTDSRVVYLGSAAALQVLDGARQALRTGSVVVDAQHGPGLRLQVAGLTVATPGGAAVRAERGVTVRVGTLAGSADLTSSTGRRLAVPALHQTMVGGDALPDETTPLRLTDDAGEARAVPQLVRDDRTLISLARGIDSTGHASGTVVRASLQWPLIAPEGAGRSEKLLPAVIAAAGPSEGARARYRAASGYRAAGGSWAVVARLVGVGAADVVTTLAGFQRSQPAGQVGDVADVLAVIGAAPPTQGDRPPGDDRGDDAEPDDQQSPTPTSSPTPGPTPTDDGGGLVSDTIDTVLSLVPTPPPSDSPKAPGLDLPLPDVTLPGLPPLP